MRDSAGTLGVAKKLKEQSEKLDREGCRSWPLMECGEQEEGRRQRALRRWEI